MIVLPPSTLGTRDVVQRGAADPARVDPVMLVKPAVLDRDDGLGQIGRQLVGLDRLAVIDAPHREWLAGIGRVDRRRQDGRSAAATGESGSVKAA